MDTAFLVALAIVNNGIVVWLTILLDRVNARLDIVAEDTAFARRDIQRRAKRRAREAAATEAP